MEVESRWTAQGRELKPVRASGDCGPPTLAAKAAASCLLLLLPTIGVKAQLPPGSVVVPGRSAESFDPSKIDTSKLPVLDLSDKSVRADRIQASELKRAHRYDIRNSPMIDAGGAEHAPIPRTVDGISAGPFPIKIGRFVISDLVVVGTVSKATAHISSSGSDVYSVYQIVPSETLLGTPPSATPFEIERAGGVVKFPSGKWAIDGVSGCGILQAGHKYVLFVRPPSSTGSRLLATAYEITPGNIVYPIDTDTSHAIEKYSGVPLATFMTDLKAAAAKEGAQ